MTGATGSPPTTTSAAWKVRGHMQISSAAVPMRLRRVYGICSLRISVTDAFDTNYYS